MVKRSAAMLHARDDRLPAVSVLSIERPNSLSAGAPVRPKGQFPPRVHPSNRTIKVLFRPRFCRKCADRKKRSALQAVVKFFSKLTFADDSSGERYRKNMKFIVANRALMAYILPCR